MPEVLLDEVVSDLLSFEAVIHSGLHESRNLLTYERQPPEQSLIALLAFYLHETLEGIVERSCIDLDALLVLP